MVTRGSPRRVATWSIFLRILFTATLLTPTVALSQKLCSSQNTGSGSAVTDNYQSNGACSTQCSGYAFAVVQGKSCWCSNYAPGDTTSAGSCNVPCPGYPYENCGDQSAGLYGYVALGPAPSGTKGSNSDDSSDSTPSPTANSINSPSPKQNTVTVQDTVIASPSVQVSYVSLTPSSPSPSYVPVTVDASSSSTPITSTTSSPTTTDTPTSSKDTPTSSWSATPYISIETVTGQVKTMTVTPTAPPAAVETVVSPQAEERKGGFFTDTGKVAGTFVAVAIVILLAAGLVIFFVLRKRKRDAEGLPVPSVAGGNTPQRRPSRMSQMGLLGRAATGSAGSQRERGAPMLQTSGLGTGNGSEKSPADTIDRRSSYPRVVDQRLEPTALWNPIHDNGSHISVKSFRDDQDYSRRMLRIANPDD